MAEEAGFLNFIDNKSDDHQFFRNHSQYESDHFLSRDLISPRGNKYEYFELMNHSQHESNRFLARNLISGRANTYNFLNVISQGSYGVVCKARHRKTLEIVAIKHEFHGLSRSTLREIATLTSLPRHPAVIEFKEVVVDDRDRVFIVMEHVENDLKRFMDVRKKPLNLNEVKCIMKQFLEGVRFLHENGLMHRDLKPSNILINRKGGLKICDFGLSRKFASECRSCCADVGALWYKAPEILIGAETYSCAIDMWSVGFIMAELLLKEVLSKGRCDLEQIAQIYIVLGSGEPDDNRLMQKFLAAASSTGAPALTELGFDLLKKLLGYDPEKRITAEAALNHGWFKEFDP
ncbi:UNVERIFIED_CONTAM: Cyclin-dependent kinase G-1 [Sesamum radiatum]|uniref:Cyclin-dependent kinase G-1 n=1 Tax=Sesamum radiatum TaxID=300843 RepID=A0AAW2WM90_SESRA